MIKNRLGLSILGIILGVVCGIGGVSSAFQFSPISISINPTEEGEFIVTNDNDGPIAVTLTANKRAMTEKGEDVLTDAEDELLVYPYNMIVAPHASRKVQVRWLGDKAITQEAAFRVIAEQLPVNIERKQQQNGAQLQVLLRYVASLYVRPAGAKSNLEVRQVSRVSTPKPLLRVTVANTGNRQTLIQDPVLTVNGVTLEGKELGEMVGGNVLAQSVRTFEIPLPAKLANFSTSSQAGLKYRESF